MINKTVERVENNDLPHTFHFFDRFGSCYWDYHGRDKAKRSKLWYEDKKKSDKINNVLCNMYRYFFGDFLLFLL
ncbi:hypothetical protein SAM19_04663 [Brevibacillus laterosporus]|nr:hypothetical protein [Brevibacillus laterosporus]